VRNTHPPGRIALALLVLSFVATTASQFPLRPVATAQNVTTGTENSWETVVPGIEHLRIVRGHKSEVESTGPWLINLLRVDLTKARLRLVHGMDEAVGLETVSSLAARYDAVAAVNSGYFRTTGTYRGESIGVAVLSGKLLSEPHNKRAAMGLIDAAGTTEVVFGHLNFSASLQAGKPRSSYKRGVDGFNRPRGDNELIVFTPEFHRTTLTASDGLELIVRQGRVTEFRDHKGSSVIPPDGYVVSAAGKAREWAKKFTPGTRIKLVSSLIPLESDREALWQRAGDIIGGGPQLIRNGQIKITAADEKMAANFDTDRHPRTAVGKLADGKLLFVTVDGRQPGVSAGMPLSELAALLLEWGTKDAINLDGGGSTTMVIKNKIVNKPSDQTGERPVSDAILIFAR